MANNDGFRRYLEAGAVLGAVTRARAEEIVQDLVAGGDVQREQAQQWIDDLVERSRQASEDLLDLVRTEVNEQLASLGVTSLDELARQVADLLRRSSEAGRQATHDAASSMASAGRKSAAAAKTAAKKASKSAKTAAKKAPAKKATTKKAPAKKTAAKKATTKKAPAKKTTAKKAPAKKTTAKKAPAKKTTAKKAPAKRAPAKKAAPAPATGS